MGQEESHDVEMDLAEVQEMCIIFMKECPSGVLHLHEFKRIFGVLSSSEEESMYFETIFHSFNTNQDNALDLMEYAEALHLVLRGNLEDRLKWSFKIYDKDRNGKLDRHKVEQIIRIIYSIKLQREEIKMTPNEVCDRIFELVDLNHNGRISLEEFIEGSQKDPWVTDQLKLDITPCGWFLNSKTKP
ncbi:unnamed protein product [Lota lota]